MGAGRGEKFKNKELGLGELKAFPKFAEVMGGGVRPHSVCSEVLFTFAPEVYESMSCGHLVLSFRSLMVLKGATHYLHIPAGDWGVIAVIATVLFQALAGPLSHYVPSVPFCHIVSGVCWVQDDGPATQREGVMFLQPGSYRSGRCLSNHIFKSLSI